MPETQLFESSNQYSSLQTQGGGNVIARQLGWCAAASALWCASRIQGAPIAQSKPDILRAGVLQVRYRWDPAGGGQDVVNLFNVLECTANQAQQGVGLEPLLTALIAAPGVYHINNGFHAMAVDTRTTLYFYDIESGLYRYSDAIEWKAGIRRRYQGANQWGAFAVT
ncbi:hypothetical protein SAMN02745857_01483 [Andreprevotia lacus DSM 23236]|jgi:hypothetical protein|uniref:Peptidase C39-like domain-containing protein n=1 Tax=Andreprevotia lacus DSM 23236 TaxID=1121001 RepID=A0A1W1XGC1_9NEIS|nr:hypothetical protein [Andreprevotia lacus]SMC22834.1 hypothetical protein SAMN02745857_01483 [Andreprevotia lacus DSM 23236]